MYVPSFIHTLKSIMRHYLEYESIHLSFGIPRGGWIGNYFFYLNFLFLKFFSLRIRDEIEKFQLYKDITVYVKNSFGLRLCCS